MASCFSASWISPSHCILPSQFQAPARAEKFWRALFSPWVSRFQAKGVRTGNLNQWSPFHDSDCCSTLWVTDPDNMIKKLYIPSDMARKFPFPWSNFIPNRIKCCHSGTNTSLIHPNYQWCVCTVFVYNGKVLPGIFCFWVILLQNLNALSHWYLLC